MMKGFGCRSFLAGLGRLFGRDLLSHCRLSLFVLEVTCSGVGVEEDEERGGAG